MENPVFFHEKDANPQGFRNIVRVIISLEG